MKRRLGVIAALLVIAAACGARVSDSQRLAAQGVGGAAGPGDAASADGSAPGVSGSPVGGAAAAPAEGPSAAGTNAGAATQGAPAASGDNGGSTDVGVTGTTITMGTVATLSGPIPGLFQGAAIGAQAFAAYINSQGGIGGRKLKIDVVDDQFDTGQNRAAVNDLSHKALGFLGSFSTFDDAGGADMQANGVPDIGYGLTDARRTSTVNFSPQPGKSGTFRTGPFEYYAKKFPDAVKAMGSIYGDIPASKGGAVDSMAAAQSVGWKFVYVRGAQPTETDFTADVIRMKAAGVKGFYTVATDPKSMARILLAMQQQNFHPEFVGFGASAYDPQLTGLAGDAANGVWVDQQLAMYAGGDSAAIPEVALMNQWVQKVKPGFTPDLYTAFSWASGRMLQQALAATGPRVTRKGLLAALAKIDNFDANGLLAPSGPGTKKQATCDMFMRIDHGKYVRQDPAGKGFLCIGHMFPHG